MNNNKIYTLCDRLEWTLYRLSLSYYNEESDRFYFYTKLASYWEGKLDSEYYDFVENI
jgi:hypothetical protein